MLRIRIWGSIVFDLLDQGSWMGLTKIFVSATFFVLVGWDPVWKKIRPVLPVIGSSSCISQISILSKLISRAEDMTQSWGVCYSWPVSGALLQDPHFFILSWLNLQIPRHDSELESLLSHQELIYRIHKFKIFS